MRLSYQCRPSKPKDCKYCGELIYFSAGGTPVNVNKGDRHTCDNYALARQVEYFKRSDLSEEEIMRYELAANA